MTASARPTPTTSTSRPAAPPPARRDDHVEDLHGHRVADPYRWLERPAGDPEVRGFVAQQNACSEPALRGLPAREAFRSRLTRLWDQPRRGAPWRRGDRWFQLAGDGLQDQDVLWVAPADGVEERRGRVPAAGWRVLVDPNGWSADGTAALGAVAVSDDGSRVAIGRSDAGSDWVTWHVVEAADGTWHPDEVRWSKFAPAAWLPDASAFLYAAYDPPAAGEEHAAAVRDQQLRLHRLGTEQADDPVVHARPDQPEWGFWPSVSHDGRWLVLTIHRGTDPTTRIHVAPIADGRIGPVRPLLDDGAARYEPLGVLDDELLVVTDAAAPLGRVVAAALTGAPADVEARSPALREVVPTSTDRLEAAHLVGAAAPGSEGWLACRWLRHATSRLSVHDPRTGTLAATVPLPGPVTVTAGAGGRHDDALYVTLESFTAPGSVWRVDLPQGTVTGEVGGSPVRGPASGAAAPEPGGSGFAGSAVGAPEVTTPEPHVEQILVRHDGVAVPLFLVHRADVAPDGARPTVLWGYGGFDRAVTPMFRAAWRAWVDAGGVLAVACLRGGGEYGRAWHDDGRLARKQHVFDDALACAAWLTGRRRDEVDAVALTEGSDTAAVWSAPPHLGIEGRSNGGLLVGACITQEPQAFGSAVPEVGVLDMTRFHRFTIGWAWTSDFGDPDVADDLAVVLRYSPYHRLREGVRYPATLITTGDTDDRVVPAHSYKFAAALQRAQTGDAPVLLRVDTAAGHGVGKPIRKLIEERADVLAFHAAHLGLEVAPETA